jgi:hypothetical protein
MECNRTAEGSRVAQFWDGSIRYWIPLEEQVNSEWILPRCAVAESQRGALESGLLIPERSLFLETSDSSLVPSIAQYRLSAFRTGVAKAPNRLSAREKLLLSHARFGSIPFDSI